MYSTAFNISNSQPEELDNNMKICPSKKKQGAPVGQRFEHPKPDDSVINLCSDDEDAQINNQNQKNKKLTSGSQDRAPGPSTGKKSATPPVRPSPCDPSSIARGHDQRPGAHPGSSPVLTTAIKTPCIAVQDALAPEHQITSTTTLPTLGAAGSINGVNAARRLYKEEEKDLQGKLTQTENNLKNALKKAEEAEARAVKADQTSKTVIKEAQNKEALLINKVETLQTAVDVAQTATLKAQIEEKEAKRKLKFAQSKLDVEINLKQEAEKRELQAKLASHEAAAEAETAMVQKIAELKKLRQEKELAEKQAAREVEGLKNSLVECQSALQKAENSKKSAESAFKREMEAKNEEVRMLKASSKLAQETKNKAGQLNYYQTMVAHAESRSKTAEARSAELETELKGKNERIKTLERDVNRGNENYNYWKAKATDFEDKLKAHEENYRKEKTTRRCNNRRRKRRRGDDRDEDSYNNNKRNNRKGDLRDELRDERNNGFSGRNGTSSRSPPQFKRERQHCQQMQQVVAVYGPPDPRTQRVKNEDEQEEGEYPSKKHQKYSE